MAHFNPEDLTRRAQQLNMDWAAEADRQAHERRAEEADRAAARERVAGHLGVFLEWAAGNRLPALPLYLALGYEDTPPAPGMLWRVTPGSWTRPDQYYKYQPDGQAYQLSYTYYEGESGGSYGGTIVTTDARCYSATPTYIRDHNGFDHLGYVREARYGGYGMVDPAKIDIATMEDGIEDLLTNAAAAYLRGEFPPVHDPPVY